MAPVGERKILNPWDNYHIRARPGSRVCLCPSASGIRVWSCLPLTEAILLTLNRFSPSRTWLLRRLCSSKNPTLAGFCASPDTGNPRARIIRIIYYAYYINKYHISTLPFSPNPYNVQLFSCVYYADQTENMGGWWYKQVPTRTGVYVRLGTSSPAVGRRFVSKNAHAGAGQCRIHARAGRFFFVDGNIITVWYKL